MVITDHFTNPTDTDGEVKPNHLDIDADMRYSR